MILLFVTFVDIRYRRNQYDDIIITLNCMLFNDTISSSDSMCFIIRWMTDYEELTGNCAGRRAMASLKELYSSGWSE
jgi:hypothetical protein